MTPATWRDLVSIPGLGDVVDDRHAAGHESASEDGDRACSVAPGLGRFVDGGDGSSAHADSSDADGDADLGDGCDLALAPTAHGNIWECVYRPLPLVGTSGVARICLYRFWELLGRLFLLVPETEAALQSGLPGSRPDKQSFGHTVVGAVSDTHIRSGGISGSRLRSCWLQDQNYSKRL